jgi:hypothetical protein
VEHDEQVSESVEQSYEAPVVVDLGSVEQMTQATLEVFADAPVGSRPGGPL